LEAAQTRKQPKYLAPTLSTQPCVERNVLVSGDGKKNGGIIGRESSYEEGKSKETESCSEEKQRPAHMVFVT
jgi:hypothetical protein